ncbi:NADPH:quinone reductase-like Zn-dependent oxidoreductase [Ureibacillus xyleni]|uniref:NADPH:quinone reductase-like Zn-dependent oxidoreductase n=1 Tax=Ureibacillus xyleni TaxID=614648 RepID=A0A285TAT2_9BACL|nr:NADPH:quinone reductase [Ureibacillus xyleni]SOC16688.1 NADPH:quinone reductase-like Zn-dependent oxidoreductase [Ureibacillus xyleni]
MKAIQMTTFGEPDVLQYKTIEDPQPDNNEVCVKLYAAGVNPNEAYVRTGTYAFLIPDLPYTPGFDGAGIVESIGEGVTHVKIGDRVFVAALLAKRNTGTYAEKVVCDANTVHLLPDSVSYEQGAALGIPAITAYRALFQRANIKPGETVLIHGASGGVGLLAVQMATSFGATVIGTASSEEGKQLVKSSGAQYVCNHVKVDAIDEILALTNGIGPDVIIEFLANENLETDLKLIAPYGRIVIIGNRGTIEINPRLTMVKECDILGTAIFNIPKKEYEECLIGVSALLKSGVLIPQVGNRLPLSEAKQAHIDILTKKAKGKMVLLID